MEVLRYGSRRLPVLVAGVVGIALALCAPASAADRGGGGNDYLLTSPTLTIDDVILNEGDPPPATTTFTFTIALSKAAPNPVCVDVYTMDGTATTADNDYQPVSTTICIPANTTTYTVDVLVNRDLVGEPDEVFFLKLANPTGGASIGDGSGTGLILNDDIVVPTLLQTFDASSAEDGISVRWQFANVSEVANSWLERSVAQSDSWARVDAEISSEDGLLMALDRNIESEQTYQYRLTAQMKDGQTLRFGPITVTSGVIVKEFALARVSPNPTPGNAVIDYSVPRSSHIRLSVLDVQGRQVEVLVDGVVGAGRHQATWKAGSVGGSGVYFVRLETPNGKNYVKRVVVQQ